MSIMWPKLDFVASGPKIMGIIDVLLIAVSVLTSFSAVYASSGFFEYQVGAYGSADSVGNRGVRAEIRTHIYEVNSSEGDGFWIGDFLESGAFIQSGYIIPPRGGYCSSEEIKSGTRISCTGEPLTVNGSEALWFWEYWPDAVETDYYVGWGPLGQASVNGTWHSYALSPDTEGDWAFSVDGTQLPTLRLNPQAAEQGWWLRNPVTFQVLIPL
jgi:hypothetical protein